MKKQKFNEYIQAFNFKDLFNDLGWDFFENQFPVAATENTYLMQGVAQKKGFVILQCILDKDMNFPHTSERKQIEKKIAKTYFEHLIIFTDFNQTQQLWQLTIKEPNKPRQVRDVNWHKHQDTEKLYQKLKNLFFSLDDEEHITIVDVKNRFKEHFAKNTEKVTKKFYTEFKKQQSAFLDFIEGIDDHLPKDKNNNKKWYGSLMLNRLMFCYFIQKKGYLDNDTNYLQNKLNECKTKADDDKFYSFYRSFLLELFHDGLGKPESKRPEKLPVNFGRIPYLNGGLFDVHELENQFLQIHISDQAFERIFNFFDQWNWHLDDREEAKGNNINPDVIGYIFEKYINDRAQMGAYYTKEDITDYISKNTIIPKLFDDTQKQHPKAFQPDSELWQFLKNSGDTYIYEAIKKGIPEKQGLFDDLPGEIQAGFDEKLSQKIVTEATPVHLWEKRKVWNKKAPESIALPTETYRELIERRTRYAEVKQKIENGEITQINDFITYNLNIRQFVQDFIEQTQDPDFIKAFYKALEKITILDPTCGSGAFLFAALNILEPLYEGTIRRMETFLSEAADERNFSHLPAGLQKVWKTIPHKDSWFNKTYRNIHSGHHPNLKYFIYKSIILHNLYGVDIMKEAVEIAKLRLFLKLVSTVEKNARHENLGLEPLPDIDFNIRAGNTLVGFATAGEFLKSVKVLPDGNYRMDWQEQYDTYKEEIEHLSRFYNRFVEEQLSDDANFTDIKTGKQELQQRLGQLNEKLNKYLAKEYGIAEPDGKEKNKYENWLHSHQPFHWFAEFYQIIEGNKGFDCVIGNPPYVVYSENSFNYTLQGFKCIDCKDLYGYTIERTYLLNNPLGKNGMIVPISLVSTDGFASLRNLMLKKGQLFLSHYAMRPGKLFDGVDKHLTIFIASLGQKTNLFSSKYHRWGSENRNSLFPKIEYVQILKESIHNSSIPKISNNIQQSIIIKVKKKKSILFELTGSGNFNVYHTRKLRYFLQFLDCAPEIYEEDGSLRVTSEIKVLKFTSEANKTSGIAALLSSLFFWYYIDYSDCRNVNKREVHSFPIELSEMNNHLKTQLSICGEGILSNLQENSYFLTATYKKYGTLKMQTFRPRKSKTIADRIDTILAEYYGFAEEELDFIINYDIKYRMGDELEAYINGTF